MLPPHNGTAAIEQTQLPKASNGFGGLISRDSEILECERRPRSERQRTPNAHGVVTR
jgi:hypothetical protein